MVGMGKSVKVVGIEEICQHDWDGGNLPRWLGMGKFAKVVGDGEICQGGWDEEICQNSWQA